MRRPLIKTFDWLLLKTCSCLLFWIYYQRYLGVSLCLGIQILVLETSYGPIYLYFTSEFRPSNFYNIEDDNQKRPKLILELSLKSKKYFYRYLNNDITLNQTLYILFHTDLICCKIIGIFRQICSDFSNVEFSFIAYLFSLSICD